MSTHSTTPCPACEYQVSYYNGEASSHFVCPNCTSLFVDATDEEKRSLATFPSEAGLPVIGIGQTCGAPLPAGRLTAWMVKRETDADELVEWEEYIITPNDGSAPVTLVFMDARWYQVRALDYACEVRKLGVSGYMAIDQGATHELERSYRFELRHARGEFDWNPLDDSNAMTVFEYEGTTTTLVNEEVRGESKWYRATPLSVASINRAFGLELFSAEAHSEAKQIDRFKFTLIVVGIIVLFKLAMSATKPERVALRESISAEYDSAGFNTGKTFRTASFSIHGPAAVEIAVGAPVSNSWAELDGELINEQTGRSYSFVRTIEYYSGYEGGEHWSEGSNEGVVKLSSVPSGTYHINATPTAEAGALLTYGITVTENARYTSNLILLLIIVLGIPGFEWYQRNKTPE